LTDLRDKLLTLDREGLAREAHKLGIAATESMSRAELITIIEKQYALQEFGELKSYSEYRFVFVGLFFIALATFILALLTFLEITGWSLSWIVAPIYLVFRGLGGFILAAALMSLAFKTSYQNITPVVRAALIIGAVLIIVVVLVIIPLPAQWSIP
jgi:hypothetical protein